MKTTTSFLPVLLICIFCFAIGCGQQVADPVTPDPVTPNPVTPNPVAPASVAALSDNQPQEKTDPLSTTIENNGGVVAKSNHNDLPTIAIAGSPSAENPSLPQTPDLSDQVADAPPQPNNDNSPSSTDTDTDTDTDGNNEEELAEPTINIPAHWKQLSKTREIWVDHKNKQVIVGGKVCLDAGQLEMLICPRGTKEHETIVSVNAASWQVHAALLAVGAKQGVPCRWVPEYTPSWGPKIDVQMMWRDEKTNKVKTIDGKQWILDVDTQKPITHEFVFGGSIEQIREGRRQYLADAGELICLANFSTSAIDLRIVDPNANLFFEANTPLIPPINTQIYTIIKPGPVVGKPEP